MKKKHDLQLMPEDEFGKAITAMAKVPKSGVVTYDTTGPKPKKSKAKPKKRGATKKR